ncbi:MAG TPA: TetR/AcrR family transcriptional regulator [Steroidobacteraceae bacterium]|nr:TetR/AcrR family transcriptional regulator [Steroidobacteraceae bacterium]
MSGAAPVRARRTQLERTALSDRKLAEAAISLLIERGISGTTLIAIGERAGYSRGLVTHRFGSKAGLLAHVHDAIAAHWIEWVQSRVGDATGVQALERVVDALYEFIVEAPDELRALYLLRYASIDPAAEYRANVAKFNKAQRRDAQSWIEAGKAAGELSPALDAHIAAELFCASADGLIYRWMVIPSLPVRELHDQLRDGIRDSLCAAHPGGGGKQS